MAAGINAGVRVDPDSGVHHCWAVLTHEDGRVEVWRRRGDLASLIFHVTGWRSTIEAQCRSLMGHALLGTLWEDEGGH